MTLRTQILVMVALVFFMIELIYLLRKKELILKYSLIWILITVLLGIGAIAPEPFCDLMGIIGIRYSMNGLFLALLGGGVLDIGVAYSNCIEANITDYALNTESGYFGTSIGRAKRKSSGYVIGT